MRNEIMPVMAFFKITHPKVQFQLTKWLAKVRENIDSDVSNFRT